MMKQMLELLREIKETSAIPVILLTANDTEMDVVLGGLENGADNYGPEKLTALEGKLSRLSDPSSRYIAAVCAKDDYGNAIVDSYWARLGDVVTIRCVEEWEYYDIETGEILAEDSEYNGWYRHAKDRDVEYQVVALVTVPAALGYRYYGSDEFVLGADIFIEVCFIIGLVGVLNFLNTALR